ncbi:MAG: polysaccharide deacetylase family protein, partial [Deltaproteobacteria bacterium]|nr:polysaccharide deacetylase family protein [Deltaproteobacteria bacterium]
MTSVPVLTFHSVAPGERLGPEILDRHLSVLAGLGGTLPLGDLGGERAGALVTFDDGFADLWTHGLEILERHGVRAVVFAIPSRAGEGPARPRGRPAWPGRA